MKKNALLSALICVTIVASIFGAENVFAQLTARGVGMGGAYTALARGAHAPAWNPANLGLPDNPQGLSMDIFSVGAQLSNNSFTKSMYDQYNGKYWDTQTVTDILDHVPSNGLAVDLDVAMNFLSFSYGRFAMTLGASGGGFLKMDKTIFDLVLKGNELNKTYTLKNADGESMAVGYLGLSWGQPVEVDFVEHLSIGWTTYLLQGIAYGHLDDSDVLVKTTQAGFDLDGSYQASSGLGNLGVGIDLGAAAQINEQWAASLCLANLFSRITWNKKNKTNYGYFGGESLAVLDFSDEDEKDDFQDSTWTEEGHDLSQGLPVTLRAGTTYEYEDFVFTADYVQGFSRRMWTVTTPQLALGTEWRRVHWLPLRIGFAAGGNVGFGTSFGLGIRPGRFVFDLGMMNRGFVTSGGSKGLFLAVDIGVNLSRVR